MKKLTQEQIDFLHTLDFLVDTNTDSFYVEIGDIVQHEDNENVVIRLNKITYEGVII
jgi:hypothetical protein